jgi:hypothetical protein
MTKKTTHLEAKYDKMKRNYDNLVNDVAMLKKQTPGGTNRSAKRRRGKAAVDNDASGAEDDDSEWNAEVEVDSCPLVGQKRHRSNGIPRPTLRGLVVGSRRIEATRTLTPCVLFGDDFSSWASCIGELGFRANVVVLDSPTFLPLIRSLVEASCQIFVGGVPSGLNISAQIAFIDGRIITDRFQMGQDFGLTTMVATRGLRAKIYRKLSAKTR